MQSMLKMKMTFDLQSKMEVIVACFIWVTFALFFSNSRFELQVFHCWHIWDDRVSYSAILVNVLIDTRENDEKVSPRMVPL